MRTDLLLLTCLLLWAAPALAQPEAANLPPPDGWPLRRVTTLTPAPEPPGGLVPYRKGKLWGFADTTGRVWVRPVFPKNPGFFEHSFVQYKTYRSAPDTLETWYPLPADATRRQHRQQWRRERQELLKKREARRPDTLLLLNARGEYLLSSWARPRRLVRASDSSGAFTERPTSTALYRNPTAPARFYSRLFLDPAGNSGWGYAGNGRFLASRWKWWWPFAKRTVASGWYKCYLFRYTRAALFTATGRRVTRYQFEQIGRFRRGVAWYAVDTLGLGLLDTAGRQLTPPRFQRVHWSGKQPNVYLVQIEKTAALNLLVDGRGKPLIGPGAASLSVPDSAGFVRQALLTAGGAQVQFLRLNGQPAFAGSFEQAGPFWRGRAEARQAGKYGLLDTTGHWVIPPLYDAIEYYPAESRYARAYADRPTDRLDSAFRLMQIASSSEYTTVLTPDSVVGLRRGALHERRRALNGELVTVPLKAFRLYQGVCYFDGTTSWCQWATGATTRLGDAVRVERHIYTPHGYRFVVTRTSDGRRAVVDSAGRRYSPWYRRSDSDSDGPVFLEHAVICVARDSSYLLDATGRPLWATAHQVAVADNNGRPSMRFTGITSLVDENYRLRKPQDRLTIVYDWTGRIPAWPAQPSGVVAVFEGSATDTSWRQCVLDQWGNRIVCGQFHEVDNLAYGFEGRPGIPGWARIENRVHARYVLNPQGQLQPVSPKWRDFDGSLVIPPCNSHLLWKTDEGYITLAGRRLWAD